MFEVAHFLTILSLALGADVYDQFNQEAVIVSEYCPSIPGCQDGTHVMCLHYHPESEMGPGCVHPVNITMTPDLAQLIVDISNRIRSKIANGLGRGEEAVDLPKAYGMYRLSWDTELATLAQVWANQCIFSLDLCRSTRRFPTVGQVVGMSRYTLDTWMPISEDAAQIFNTSTLTPDKVRYAITYILKAWYETKNDVLPDVIEYFDIKSYSKHNQFVQLVSGPSTHVGCGISAYREYSYNNNNAALNYNSIQLVCNFSHQPRVDESVYQTKPPTEPGYTVKCGCPLGYDEDEDCLCYETERELPYSCKSTGRCKPSVVVLPIFTVEDAPIHSIGQNKSSQITPAVGPDVVLKRRINSKDYSRSQKNHKQAIKQDSTIKSRRINVDVKKRYFTERKGKKQSRLLNEHYRRHTPRQSIFAKAAVFELPSRLKQYGHKVNNYKKDVAPRRDFREVHTIVSKYLEGRKMGIPLRHSIERKNLTISRFTEIPSYTVTITSTPHTVNRFKKDKFNYGNLNTTKMPRNGETSIKPLNEDTDQMLMDLLDKLEEEVNNIHFNTKEKEFFDEKIRKIYGTLIKKPVVVEPKIVVPNTNVSLDYNVDNNLIENDMNGHNFWSDSNKVNAYSYPQLEDRPINEKSYKKQKENINEDKKDTVYKKSNKFPYNKPLYNFDIDERELSDMYLRKKSRLNALSRGKVRNEDYFKSDLEDYNSLDSDRRRHYYDKLSNLQRKISLMKKHKRQNFVSGDRHIRPVRPPKHPNLSHNRPKEMELYMPNRARFLHGF
ncbi:uncharacterized protein LOC116774994 isoform X1 [Danaus plexippus]|uniref:uncharacterized protein LOC116774994 isoform X1 n=2 Tax=Danaus plexippus TaxID=13037 RepID=UPI002AB2B9C6|nr:uncharacterized protein LOC116774994 isoform X1 [Danaus plexippus]